MRTTLDLPDDLYALVKARAALEGRTLRSVVEELLKGWVGSTRVALSSAAGAPTPAVSEPRLGYDKRRNTKRGATQSGVEGRAEGGALDSLDSHRAHLRNLMEHPRSLDEIAGVLTEPGPDMDMARMREIYQQRLAEEWKRRLA